MNDNTRILILKKEVETYRNFASALEKLKKTILSFDGKCFNKRFSDAMNECLNKEKKNYYINIRILDHSSSFKFFDIIIDTCDNSICSQKSLDKTGDYITYFIRNSTCLFRMKLEDITTKTKNGKYRIHAHAIVERIDEKIKSLNQEAVTLESSLCLVDSMLIELKNIQKLMDDFDKRYDSRILELFGCCYELKNTSPFQYR